MTWQFDWIEKCSIIPIHAKLIVCFCFTSIKFVDVSNNLFYVCLTKNKNSEMNLRGENRKWSIPKFLWLKRTDLALDRLSVNNWEPSEYMEFQIRMKLFTLDEIMRKDKTAAKYSTKAKNCTKIKQWEENWAPTSRASTGKVRSMKE